MIVTIEPSQKDFWEGKWLGPTHGSTSLTTGPSSPVKIGLALSGGGARGFAQIGVLQVLEREGINVNCIAGTSIGGVIGGLYAAGYRAAELERLAETIDWSELFTNQPKRSSLFVSQKEEADRHLIAVRFDGVRPSLPVALTAGQKLSDLLASLTYRANYRAGGNFDRLPIPYRTVATDLVTGEKVLFDRGDLWEAMRATIAIPLAISPLEKGQRVFVDGGLVDPVPVDVAREMGAELVIAVSTVSDLAPADRLQDPIDIANQVTTVMSAHLRVEQLARADVVVAPVLGDLANVGFNRIGAAIQAGREAAEQVLPWLREEIRKRKQALRDEKFSVRFVRLEGSGASSAEKFSHLLFSPYPETLSREEIQAKIDSLFASGLFRTARAELHTASDTDFALVYHLEANPTMRAVYFTGNSIFSEAELQACAMIPPTGDLRLHDLRQAAKSVDSLYRSRGYDLAGVQSITYDTSGAVQLAIEEGRIEKITVTGNSHTRRWVVTGDFPLKAGMAFNGNLAARGVANLYASDLFERVGMNLTAGRSGPVVELNVKEKKFVVLRVGGRYNDDYHTEVYGEAGHTNLFGIGNEADLVGHYGSRKWLAGGRFQADQIFRTMYTYRLGFSAGIERRYRYLAHEKVATFDDRRIGITFSLGRHLARLGRLSLDGKWERVQAHFLDQKPDLKYFSGTLAFRSTVDTRDRTPFPTRGNHHEVRFTYAGGPLGSDVRYRSAAGFFENFFPLARRTVINSRLALGFSGSAIPLPDQFRLGGAIAPLAGFASGGTAAPLGGAFRDEFTGPQLFAASLGLRHKMGDRLYLGARGDLGNVWEKTGQMRFSDLRRGALLSGAVGTPVGPLEVDLGFTQRQKPRLYFFWGHQF